MLFERTAISQKPEELIRQELSTLKDNGNINPDLVFKSPYFLDFTGLTGNYSEKSLEDAILKDLELLQLDKSGIKVAEYLTELPDKKLLKAKLHSVIEANKSRLLDNAEGDSDE